MTDIRQIRFLLPQLRIECNVSRGDEPRFEAMREGFRDELRWLKRSHRKCRLSVSVEPSPPAPSDRTEAQRIEEQVVEEEEEEEEEEKEDDMWI